MNALHTEFRIREDAWYVVDGRGGTASGPHPSEYAAEMALPLACGCPGDSPTRQIDEFSVECVECGEVSA